MYTKLNEIIEQSTELNNRIILYTELVGAKIDTYIDDLIANTAFGRAGTIFACKGNDFVYLLAHLLGAYYYSSIQVNAGEIYEEADVFADYGLEAIREYFQITHGFDIMPLYAIFELVDDDCDPNTLFGTATTYLDLDCLIIN